MLEEYDALMDAYLKGRLDEDEARKVERLVAEDPSFREELEFRKQTTKAFTRIEHERLKLRLQELSMTAEPSVGVFPRKGNLIRWWYAAASIAIIGIMGLIFWAQQPSRTATELYMAYFEPYPNIVVPVVRKETKESNSIATAYAHYEQGDYKRAYELFQQLIKNGEADAETAFYQALSAMALSRDQEALQLLSAYMTSANPKLFRQARWYMALAYINVGETQEAAGLLEQLAASRGYKQHDAEALKSELKR